MERIYLTAASRGPIQGHTSKGELLELDMVFLNPRPALVRMEKLLREQLRRYAAYRK